MYTYTGRLSTKGVGDDQKSVINFVWPNTFLPICLTVALVKEYIVEKLVHR